MDTSEELAERRRAYDAATADMTHMLRTEFPALFTHALARTADMVDLRAEDMNLDDPSVASWLAIEVRHLAEPRILTNEASCNTCGERIRSRHRHDFVTCGCGNVHVDGGLDYLKRGWNGAAGGYTELSTHETPEQVRARLSELARSAD